MQKGKHPKFYIGNRIDSTSGVPGYISRELIERFYINENVEPQEWMSRLGRQAEIFHKSHWLGFTYVPQSAWTSFVNTYVYWPKPVKKPETGEKNSSGKNDWPVSENTDTSEAPGSKGKHQANILPGQNGSEEGIGAGPSHAGHNGGTSFGMKSADGSGLEGLKWESTVKPLKNEKVRGGRIAKKAAWARVPTITEDSTTTTRMSRTVSYTEEPRDSEWIRRS